MHLFLTETTVSAGVAQRGGGGLALFNTLAADIVNSTFENCISEKVVEGQCIWMDKWMDVARQIPRFVRTQFESNIARGSGGALFWKLPPVLFSVARGRPPAGADWALDKSGFRELGKVGGHLSQALHLT